MANQQWDIWWWRYHLHMRFRFQKPPRVFLWFRITSLCISNSCGFRPSKADLSRQEKRNRSRTREINGQKKAIRIDGWDLSLPIASPELLSPSLRPFGHRTRIRVRIRIRTLRGRYDLRKLRRRRSRHLLELRSPRHRFQGKAFPLPRSPSVLGLRF